MASGLATGGWLGGDDRTGAGSSTTGATEQATKLPTIAAVNAPETVWRTPKNGNLFMALILLEALLALLLFVVIVWWTMFSGRPKGELPPPKPQDPDDKTP
jgi:hypothetical protein